MRFEGTEQNETQRARRSTYGYLAFILLFVFVAACVAGGQAYARVAGTLDDISSAEEVRPAARRLSTEAAAPRVTPEPEAKPVRESRSEPESSDPAPEPTPTPTAAPSVESERDAAPSKLTQRPFTVLLIGTDQRDDPDDPTVRSDTLILARVDPVEGWASLLSIPRDTQVTIPGELCGGKRKINAAYACGYLHPTQYGAKVKPADAGAALAAETVEAFLGVPVDYTAQIDFRGFERVIDAIGGITINVPETIVDPAYPTEDYGTKRLVFNAGTQKLNGRTALQYARTRHADSDFGRIDRQQQVLVAALQQFRTQGLIAQVGSASRLLDIVRDTVRTTMPLNDLRTAYALADLADDIGVDRVRRVALQPERDRDGDLNLRMGAEEAIIWNRSYIERAVESFLTPPEHSVSLR